MEEFLVIFPRMFTYFRFNVRVEDLSFHLQSDLSFVGVRVSSPVSNKCKNVAIPC